MGWYIVAFLAPVAGWAIAAYVNVLLGAAAPTPAQLAGWSLIVTATLGFLINPFGGAWEEPGWRGYALPLLLRRHSALVASAVLGVMWALWHVPLFLTGLIPWPDAALVFALSFVFTAIYLRTAGSVLIAFLLHASINGAGEFFVGLFAAGDRVRMYWIMAALCAVVVIAAIVVSRDRWRRVPAVRDNDDAAIGPPLVAEATGIESDRIRPQPWWYGGTARGAHPKCAASGLQFPSSPSLPVLLYRVPPGDCSSSAGAARVPPYVRRTQRGQLEDEPKGALIRRFGHPTSGTSTEELSTMSRDTANSCNQSLLGAPEAI